MDLSTRLVQYATAYSVHRKSLALGFPLSHSPRTLLFVSIGHSHAAWTSVRFPPSRPPPNRPSHYHRSRPPSLLIITTYPYGSFVPRPLGMPAPLLVGTMYVRCTLYSIHVYEIVHTCPYPSQQIPLCREEWEPHCTSPPLPSHFYTRCRSALSTDGEI